MKKKLLLGSLILLVLVGVSEFLLIWNGVVVPNRAAAARYAIRGVDVSAYQGRIDWNVLAAADIDFAYIKATEGSSFVDARFADNYSAAQQTGLRVGAYHFFSFDSAGQTQADNFIATVAPLDNMLPPVVDVEFYADKAKDPPPADEVRAQLDVLLEQLEAHYGLRPVIYATEKSYALYLSGCYADYDIWIRGVLFPPQLPDGKSWTFWQYTDRARLDGYDGEEKFIDLNVFYGTADEFAAY